MTNKINQNSKIAEFARFCIVGGISAGIDAAVFYTLRSITAYQVALVSGYLTGLFFNYLLTIYWTFKQKPNAKNVIGVVTAHLINLFIIRMGLMRLFVSFLQMQDKLAYIPTIIISVAANFFMVRYAITKTSH